MSANTRAELVRAAMKFGLSSVYISGDRTHHLIDGQPFYPQRYAWVLNFHSPGIAAAGDGTGAFHIGLDGKPAYLARFLRTFGFYDDRAAIHSGTGWGHINESGLPVYPPLFGWVGNFQRKRCAVRTTSLLYYHILANGSPAYEERYSFVGDYREGSAVVQRTDGLFLHVDLEGRPTNGRAFLDLDVFHKAYARARDRGGWFHIDAAGNPAYEQRFLSVEPFYNGQARAETKNGDIVIIDEQGNPVLKLPKPPL
jgi:hypothetical protein